jgi:hypothetical protein
MWMATDNEICARVDCRVSLLFLEVVYIIAALVSPVERRDYELRSLRFERCYSIYYLLRLAKANGVDSDFKP